MVEKKIAGCGGDRGKKMAGCVCDGQSVPGGGLAVFFSCFLSATLLDECRKKTRFWENSNHF